MAMPRLTVSFDLSNIQKQALEFESEHENMTLDELVGWMIKQNIPSFLEVIETKDERRRQKLIQALMSEDCPTCIGQ